MYGRAMQMKYKREMDFIVAQVADFDRKLDRQIADLDDIRIIMETQKKIRDQACTLPHGGSLARTSVDSKCFS